MYDVLAMLTRQNSDVLYSISIWSSGLTINYFKVTIFGGYKFSQIFILVNLAGINFNDLGHFNKLINIHKL